MKISTIFQKKKEWKVVFKKKYFVKLLPALMEDLWILVLAYALSVLQYKSCSFWETPLYALETIQVRRKIIFSIVTEIILRPCNPEKVLGTPGGARALLWEPRL